MSFGSTTVCFNNDGYIESILGPGALGEPVNLKLEYFTEAQMDVMKYFGFVDIFENLFDSFRKYQSNQKSVFSNILPNELELKMRFAILAYELLDVATNSKQNSLYKRFYCNGTESKGDCCFPGNAFLYHGTPFNYLYI